MKDKNQNGIQRYEKTVHSTIENLNRAVVAETARVSVNC